MKNIFNHIINSRVLTTFNSINSELHYDKHSNYLFDLSHLSLIALTGDNSSEFLQGQLTCDIRLISDIQMLQGAQCNLKGRILSLLDIINWNGFKLVAAKDLIAATTTSFAKTALLSRVSIQETNEFQVFGFYLQNSEALIPKATFLSNNLYAQGHGANYCYYHLGNGFYIFLVHSKLVEEFCNPFISQNKMLGSLTWHTLRLFQKQINIYPESRGLFLPHRLDMHLSPYISFDKGCYKGQEIIARTHYRATLKHELNTYVIRTEQKIHSGQKLYKIDEEREIGELIDYSLLDNNTYLIAVSILKGYGQSARFEGHDNNICLEVPLLEL